MAIALVQKGGSQATAPGSAVTINWSPGGSSTAGNLVAVLATSYSGSAVTYAVTDQAGGNAFTRSAAVFAWDATWGIQSEIWYLANCPSGITGVKVAASSFQPTVGIAEFSGVATASPADVSATAVGSSASASSGNMTPTVAGALIFGGGPCASYVNSSAQVPTAGTGFSADYASTSSSLGLASIAEHLIQGSAAPQAVLYTLTSTIKWWALGLAFKPAGGGGGPAQVPWSPFPGLPGPILAQ